MQRRAFVRSTVLATAAGFSSRPALAELYRRVTGSPGDVTAVRGDGTKITLKGSELADFGRSLGGKLLLASDPDYEIARRILNPSFDKRPALIARPSSDAEVQRAVGFASSHGLLLAVKCGGHSFSGQSTCDDGMMIDLTGFRGVTVDPKARMAVVKGGTLLGAVDRATAPHGLVTPLGTVSHTGAGGLTTGGGFGRVARRFGLALDNVVGVDVVTANGKLVRADERENPDLYWGVRGGGGNFGIVTTFRYRLHPMAPQVLGGAVVFPFSKAPEVLALYADYHAAAPEDLYLDLVVQQAPGADPVVLLDTCYSGPDRDAERALAPIRKLGTPLSDGIKPIEYTALQRSTDISDPRALGMYLKSGFLRGISTDLAAALRAGYPAPRNRLTTTLFQHAGGAIGRIPTTATAFAHRYAKLNLIAVVGWPAAESSAEPIAWARRYWKTLEPFTEGFYTNEVETDHTSVVVNANYRENYARLVKVKERYDPANLFRLNANIKPAS